VEGTRERDRAQTEVERLDVAQAAQGSLAGDSRRADDSNFLKAIRHLNNVVVRQNTSINCESPLGQGF
jgi:hypothetical protein